MKIAQVSDFHFREFTEAAFLQAIVRRVNDLAPDLVVLTGDFVSTSLWVDVSASRWATTALNSWAKSNARDRYAILGNHDALVSSHGNHRCPADNIDSGAG